MRFKLNAPFTLICIACFIIASWPFVQYPLTDGDIWNWTWVARDVQLTGNFLTGPNDQTHGPLLAWTAGLLSRFNPSSFYLYGLFNILMTVFGTAMMMIFSRKFWNNSGIALLAGVMFTTTIAPVYLAHTPMYDWPAAICYFTFCCLYMRHLQTNKQSYLWGGLVFVGIGCLARFSIVMGLSGIFMLLSSWIMRRSLLQVFRDGILIIAAAIAFNLPWIIGQTMAHGETFLNTFVYDNIGRFVKSTRKNAEVRMDPHTFPLTALVGMIPYTFCLIATVFQKGFLKRIKTDKTTLMLLAGFLPCLILFSLSGHTKLARYIAYSFPMMILFLAHQMATFDLQNAAYRKRCSVMIFIVLLLIGTLSLVATYAFPQETKGSLLFVMMVIFLLVGTLLTGFILVTKYSHILREKAHLALPPFMAIYLIFFSVLSYEYTRAPFLKRVHDGIQRSIQEIPN